MRRSGSTNGDVTVASVELNAMHADRDEVKEAEDTGMRALGYGGRPDDEPLPACHATATTRMPRPRATSAPPSSCFISLRRRATTMIRAK